MPDYKEGLCIYRSIKGGIFVKSASSAKINAGDTVLAVFENNAQAQAAGFPGIGTPSAPGVQAEREQWVLRHGALHRGIGVVNEHVAKIKELAVMDPSAERDLEMMAATKRANELKAAAKKGNAPRPFCPLEQVAPMPNCWGMSGKVWGA